MSNIYEMPEMVSAFLDEVEEQIQLLEQGILELEKKDEVSKVIQDIFRVAHTLKGSSSAMGYEKMKSLTHEMENVLDKIRNNFMEVTKPIINVLFECTDCLTLLKRDFIEYKNDTEVDIDDIIGKLRCIQSIDVDKTEGNQFMGVKREISHEVDNKRIVFELDDDKRYTIENEKINGRSCVVCEIKISEDSLMKATRAFLILNLLNDMGEVIGSSPNVLELLDEDENITTIKYLLISELGTKELESRIKHELMDVDDANVFDYEFTKLDKEKIDTKDIENIAKIEGEIVTDKIDEINGKKKVIQEIKNEKKLSQTIRVDIERLEHMMNLVGEMVIEQTRIAQVSNILHNKYIADDSVEDLIGISSRVSRVVSELQESIMKARMVPVQQLFSRFPRLVRDLANSLGKEVELVLEGGETEMDRTIIEDITDPLIHLVRNSLDHGIEKPSTRIVKDKPSKGTLRIKAFHQENHVIVTIEDDGAGLNLEKIKQSAIKKEVISAQEAETLSEQEIINLIFQTGLSTANNVSDVSGRGVGMDIVRNHIDKLNGIIDVETKEGEGSKFTIKLPLTLAILAGLLVKIHNEIYALPMSNIIEIVRKPKNEIEYIKNQSVVVIRDKVHPLVWLHDYFKLPRENKKRNIFIVVLGIAEKRFGIVVDELVGNQEIVVKPLGSYIGKIEGISGATILGDGSVAHIFDVVGISRMISNKNTKDSDNFSNNEIQ
ncbi:chemotaxis protein CheA [Clostridium diolis]|uniref:Chemotaxis protein CheA n=1 Tax=Clostridium diolis TaxID=223919 RepID=A0AAV3VUV6_9CLOT|nr:chemotaxis protein CheA [Clostridium diolis]QES75214.1 chemotaxis protein CheA [Clostridium diolis]GEA29187.1 chemotaxis protein CheA [Clostridium diolis]